MLLGGSRSASAQTTQSSQLGTERTDAQRFPADLGTAKDASALPALLSPRAQPDAPSRTNPSRAEEQAHPSPQGHVSAFVGSANVGPLSPTIGAEVTYPLPFADHRVHAGALADLTFHDGASTLIAGGGIFAHPFGPGPLQGLKVLAVPAVEVHEGHRTFLLRTGIGYGFHLEALTLTPTVNFDVVDGHVVEVFGLSMGVGI